eukprot:scaffold257831_cov31-Tisochrysis_lutea.AAC.7
MSKTHCMSSCVPLKPSVRRAVKNSSRSMVPEAFSSHSRNNSRILSPDLASASASCSGTVLCAEFKSSSRCRSSEADRADVRSLGLASAFAAAPLPVLVSLTPRRAVGDDEGKGAAGASTGLSSRIVGFRLRSRYVAAFIRPPVPSRWMFFVSARYCAARCECSMGADTEECSARVVVSRAVAPTRAPRWAAASRIVVGRCDSRGCGWAATAVAEAAARTPRSTPSGPLGPTDSSLGMLVQRLNVAGPLAPQQLRYACSGAHR